MASSRKNLLRNEQTWTSSSCSSWLWVHLHNRDGRNTWNSSDRPSRAKKPTFQQSIRWSHHLSNGWDEFKQQDFIPNISQTGPCHQKTYPCRNCPSFQYSSQADFIQITVINALMDEKQVEIQWARFGCIEFSSYEANMEELGKFTTSKWVPEFLILTLIKTLPSTKKSADFLSLTNSVWGGQESDWKGL